MAIVHFKEIKKVEFYPLDAGHPRRDLTLLANQRLYSWIGPTLFPWQPFEKPLMR